MSEMAFKKLHLKKGALRDYLERKKLIKPTERIPSTLLERIKNAKDHSTIKIRRNNHSVPVRVTTELKKRVTLALNFRKFRRR